MRWTFFDRSKKITMGEIQKLENCCLERTAIFQQEKECKPWRAKIKVYILMIFSSSHLVSQVWIKQNQNDKFPLIIRRVSAQIRDLKDADTSMPQFVDTPTLIAATIYE